MADAKKKKPKSEEPTPSLPLTPMIDCVFLLLIFFMLAAKFKTSEGKLKAYLPNRGIHDPSPPIDIDLGELRVKLLWCQPGTIKEFRKRVPGEKFIAYYDKVRHGRVVLKVGRRYFDTVTNRLGEEWPNYNALYDHIERAKLEYSPPSYDPTKKMPVIIDAREAVPWKHTVAVLNAALKADLQEVTFAAPEIPY